MNLTPQSLPIKRIHNILLNSSVIEGIYKSVDILTGQSYLAKVSVGDATIAAEWLLRWS